MKQTLKEWIEIQIKAGYSPKEIYESLLGQGYKPDTIYQAFQENHREKAQVKQPKRKIPNYIGVFLGIFLIGLMVTMLWPTGPAQSLAGSNQLTGATAISQHSIPSTTPAKRISTPAPQTITSDTVNYNNQPIHTNAEELPAQPVPPAPEPKVSFIGTKENKRAAKAVGAASARFVTPTPNAQLTYPCTNMNCFKDKFFYCTSSNLEVFTNIKTKDFYEIVGEKNGKCLIKRTSVANPDGRLVGKSMTCALDNKKDFKYALREQEHDYLDCTGKLKDLMVSPEISDEGYVDCKRSIDCYQHNKKTCTPAKALITQGYSEIMYTIEGYNSKGECVEVKY